MRSEWKQRARTFTTNHRGRVRIRYLLYLPEAAAGRSQPLPLVLFLHGAGERGSDIDAVKRHGPPELVEQGKKFPFILVSPLCPEGEAWSVPLLHALLDKIRASHRVDPSRLYLTGLSMGGNGVWRLAMAIPEQVAALVPVCGWGDVSRVGLLKDIPVWVFHGKKDRVVPVERSEEMVRALKECGGNVRFTTYPEAGHDSWTETYNNPALFHWLLDQSRET